MLSKYSAYKVYLAVGATDLRKSIDGLSLIVQECFELDPFSRSLFVFCNKKRDKIKILEWDHTGFWLHYKRLEKESFQWPQFASGTHIEVDERSFRWLLDGLSIKESRAHKSVKERQLI